MENQVFAAPYGTGTLHVPVGLVNAYNTAAIFHYLPMPTDPPRGTSAGVEYAASFNQVPPGYSPKLSAIGPASRKIYIADGARYSNLGTPPDVDLNYKGGYGGAYADVGAFSQFSNSWNRIAAPGNANFGLLGIDPRGFAFRHSRSTSRDAGTFRLNVDFLDGHAQTM